MHLFLTVPYRLYSIPQLYVLFFSCFKLWFYSFNDFCHFFVCVAVYRVWSTGNGWNLSKAFSGMNTPCWYWHCSHLCLNVCTCSDTCPLCSNLCFKFLVFTLHSFNFTSTITSGLKKKCGDTMLQWWYQMAVSWYLKSYIEWSSYLYPIVFTSVTRIIILG